MLKRDEPAAPTHQPNFHTTIHYNAPQPEAPKEKKRRRHVARVAFTWVLSVGTFITFALYIYSTLSASNAATSGVGPSSSSAPTGTSAASPPLHSASRTTDAKPVSLKDTTQEFVADYDSAYSARPAAATLDEFWAFLSIGTTTRDYPGARQSRLMRR